MEDLISQLQAHLRGIWQYRWVAAAVAWMLALGGWAFVYSLPNDYQARARVYVDTQTILKPLLSGMTSVPNVEQQVSIMSRTLLSRPNLERVLRMVDLDVQAASTGAQERQLERLMNTIRVEATRSHDIYTITYNDQDPKLVRDVVQSLLTIFVEGSFKGKRSDSQQAVRFIDDQIRNVEQRLIAAENGVKQFKLRHSGLLPRQGIDYGAQVLQAADALGAARIELMEAEHARNTLREKVAVTVPADPRSVRVSHPEIDTRIAAVNKNLDSLRLQFTEQHPDVVAAHRLLAQLEARKVEESGYVDSDPGHNVSPLLQQLKASLADADAKVAAIRVRVHEYGLRLERLQQQSKAVPEVESQLAQLNRDYDINKDNYEKLISRREAARLSGDLSTNTEMLTFKIIDPPTVPTAPIGPKRPLLVTLVMLGALMGGAGTALLISQARPTLAGPADMRAFTGLTVLGTVSMNWTAQELSRRRRGQVMLALTASALLAAYGVNLAASLPIT